MDGFSFSGLFYLVATTFFVLGIKNLGKVRSARRGNTLASIGMLIAIVTTLTAPGIGIELDWTIVIAGLVVGGGIGLYLARTVQMTGMPEMVALFNGFGGLASTGVALSEYFGKYLSGVPDFSGAPAGYAPPTTPDIDGIALLGGHVWSLAIILSVLIGTVTFTGSLMAMGKLSGKISGNAIILPGRHLLNGALGVGIAAAAYFIGWGASGGSAEIALLAMTAGAAAFGILFVLPIGGADMPVVVSLLNSYSGIAASMAGFVIGNSLLIVAGALVGASGLMLTMVMCKAMNRSLGNVLIGGFGGAPTGGGGKDTSDYTTVKSAGAEEAAMILEAAESVIFVPGYGMAVAQAQHVVKELGEVMEKRGAKISYAIHPVAGRMPGHMNVLLAEADVPYEQLFELERINSSFKTTDVAVVIGANDVVNPEAIDNPESPIAGMPILNAFEAGTVLMIKRSLSPGYAGIKNPLFERENTYMCFGDGKAFLEDVLTELKNA